jgi:hypothetical protein
VVGTPWQRQTYINREHHEAFIFQHITSGTFLLERMLASCTGWNWTKLRLPEVLGRMQLALL